MEEKKASCRDRREEELAREAFDKAKELFPERLHEHLYEYTKLVFTVRGFAQVPVAQFLCFDKLYSTRFKIDLDMLKAVMESYADSKTWETDTVDQNTPLPLMYTEDNPRWGPLVRKHAWAVFEGMDENMDEGRLSTYIYSTVMEVAISWLINDLIITNEGHPRALVGSTDFFTTKRYMDMTSDKPADVGSRAIPGETWRMRTLRHLIAYGTGQEMICDSFEEYQSYIREAFERVLLPHNLNDNHYVVFDISFTGLGSPYVKVWDSYDSWATIDPEEYKKQMPQMYHLLTLFFNVGEQIPVYYKREDGEPNQGRTAGCAAFTFFTMVHLAQGIWPSSCTEDDEAFIRAYMWGCIVLGQILPISVRVQQ